MSEDGLRHLELGWLDGDPQGIHRSALLARLRSLPLVLRTKPASIGDADALIAVDPPRDDDDPMNRRIRDYRSSSRPVVNLRPTASTRPEDLLIVAFDGLLAQLDDDADSALLDRVLIALLRREWSAQPERYRVWLQRALLTAAIARVSEAEIENAVTLLRDAMQLGPVPHELTESNRRALASALDAPSEPMEKAVRARRQVQDWLLVSKHSPTKSDC